ncbi:MAG: sugar O-acetyltransferase [Muribaculaceae bacterium]|nr:sugar O-acetyltransferase [Muribaculaceae bacterium]
MKLIDDLMAGKWIYGFEPEVYPLMQSTEELCFQLNNTPPSLVEKRDEIIRQIFGEIGEPFSIHSPFHCDFGSHIKIGRYFFGNYNLTILDEAQVTIGDNVFIGPNCSIYTIVHALHAAERNAGLMRALPVTIEDNVWIAGNVTILPGVTIGHDAVIGAGSVVTKDIPPRVVAHGNPCRPSRTIDGQPID